MIKPRQVVAHAGLLFFHMLKGSGCRKNYVSMKLKMDRLDSSYKDQGDGEIENKGRIFAAVT